MKKLLTILFISTIFTGNLEVEGGITATGEVQSPTIQALLDQIAQLQQQIALLQAQLTSPQTSVNQLETRLFDLYVENDREYPHMIDMVSITGFDLDFASIQVLFPESHNTSGSFSLYYVCDDWSGQYFIEHFPGQFGGTSSNGPYDHIFQKGKDCRLVRVQEEIGYTNTLKIAVTAQFPSE